MQTTLNLSGQLTLTVKERGNVILHETLPNMIVNTGYAVVANALTSNNSNFITILQVGENPAPPQAGDIRIQNAATVPFSSVTVNNFSVQFDFMMNANAANDLKIVEFGLVTANGNLFSRLVRKEIIHKTDQIEIIGSWLINFKTDN